MKYPLSLECFLVCSAPMIDNGMRAGIPKELWRGVITVYQDGERVQAFTGNINPNNARVLLLDRTGKNCLLL